MSRERANFIAVERRIGLEGKLRDFVEMAWPIVEPSVTFVPGWHVDAVCDHLQAVSEGHLRDLVINIPPGCMKTKLVQVLWQPWDWIRTPGTRWIAASADGGLTLGAANASLQIMRSDWYQERWGDIFQIPIHAAAGDFRNSLNGTRFSTSIEGRAIGRHGNRFLVDDAIKPTDLRKAALETCEAWWANTVPRAVLKDGARVIVAQRLHDRDLPGIAISQGFTLLRLPMEYESKFPCVTPFGGDRRTEEGELLWPGLFDAQRVAEKKRETGSTVYAAQYQQRPVPEGGGIFKSDWFRHWTVQQVVRSPASPVVTVPDKMDRVVISVDATFKAAVTSDYVVMQVWGQKGPDFYLLDQVRARLGFEGTCAALLKLCKVWPMATTILIEDKANGSAIIETLKKTVSGIIAINPDGGKESRANAVAPIHESGNVYDPDPAVTPWVADMRAELTSFPLGAHDDTVDARTQALNWMLQKKKSNFIEAMEELKKRGPGFNPFVGLIRTE